MRLVRAVTEEHRKVVGSPQYETVVRVDDFAPVRFGTRQSTLDRTGKHSTKVAYGGWAKSLYDQVWFDSGTERSVAEILDAAEEIAFWVRLHAGDLRIL